MPSTHGPGRNPPLSPSVQRCLAETADQLGEAGVPNPRHESYALLQRATGWTLTGMLCRLQEEVPAEAIVSLGGLLERRLSREPLQHILGSTEFYGRTFHIDHRALIPRPETEILVERVVAALSRSEHKPLRILDVGTGSGVIAITLACELRNVVVDAIDIASPALEVARANITAHELGHVINLIRGDLGAGVGRAYGAVVANLPYISRSELCGLQPEVGIWEPVTALDGGPDGLTALRRLVAQAPSLLVPDGLLALETGAGQAGQVDGILRASGQWSEIRVDDDLAGIARVVSARLAC